MRVLGLCGPAGSGKSTVADYLVRNYGAKIFTLAAPLKEVIQRAFDVPTQSLYGTKAQKEAVIPGLGLSGRALMQKIGTDGIRAVFGDDFWVNYQMQHINSEKPSLAVIDDVRFLSEAEGIRAQRRPMSSNYIWKLAHRWLEAEDEHQSETEWRAIEADHVIGTATKSLDALYLEVDRACAKFGIVPILNSIEAP